MSGPRDLTRPLLAVYLAWHPRFDSGRGIAEALFAHFRRDPNVNVAGGAGLSVQYRSTPALGSLVPRDIPMSEAETSVTVLLVDDEWMSDPAWRRWAHDVIEQADCRGLSARVFPVAIHGGALDLGVREQMIRWDQWLDTPDGSSLDAADSEEGSARVPRLIALLTYQMCRMLRTYLEQLNHPAEPEEVLERYLRKVAVFLSHSKHDPNGERIAHRIRERLYGGLNLESFFDVRDIPAGVRFDAVILHQVRASAVIAIHTDSYSSREWCRKEIIEAKRWHVPLVVANCLSDLDSRSFPYLGNVPVVRMMPDTEARIDQLVSYLLDEVLKDFLWRCRVALLGRETGTLIFLPRPPELVALAGIADAASSSVMLVYPDPPLGREEQSLFATVAPKVQLQSITEWLAGAAPAAVVE